MSAQIVEDLIRNWWSLSDERDGLHREIVKAHTALHEAVENWNSLVNVGVTLREYVSKLTARSTR